MDSDTEIELAIDSTLDAADVDMVPKAPGATAPTPADGPSTSAATASPTKDGEFVVPEAPPMVDDLTLIKGMVERGEVVGFKPPLAMSAAEKRRLVEASMAAAKAKKEAEAAAAGEASTSTPAVPAPAPDADVEIASESSSDFESSSEEASDEEDKPKPAKIHKPMTIEEHAAIKAELDKMVGAGPAEASDNDDESSSEEESDVGDVLGRLGIEFMDDSEDEGAGDVGGSAITSTHEKPLGPVPPPPLAVLPEEIPLVIAGDVFSWMKEKAVETWRAKMAAAEEKKEEAKEEVKQKDDEKKDADNDDAKNDDTEKDDEKKDDAAKGDDTEKTDDAKLAAPTDDVSMDTDAKPAEAPAAAPSASPSKPTIPKFTTSGTLVIRAMQAPGQGWLEEGSLICLSDRRVLGTVFETFGPLESPFYSIRLPPPPYPYPSEENVARGTRVFFPSAPEYRKFVDMHAVRDPRFRSDASNVYDEEVGDDEMEWSDDEAEAAHKRARKAKRRGSRAPSAAPSHGGGGQSHPSLPPRPHFDYADDSMGSLHGGDEDWENASDAGSTMSTASQRALVSYDDVTPSSRGSGGGRGKRGGRGGRGRGRGQGQGQGRPTGGGRQQQQQDFSHPLPPRPNPNWQAPNAQAMGMGFQQGMYQPYQPAGYNPTQPNMGMPMGMMSGMMPMGMPGMPMGGMAMGMGMPGMGMGGMGGDAGAQGNAPAINPRFAQMMGMPGMGMGGYWPGDGQGGQGGQQGQGDNTE